MGWGDPQKVEHHGALAYPEIAAFTGALRNRKERPRALEFAIVTASRIGEVIGARRSEFKLAEHLSIIPGERMKAGKEHRVPLSDDAMAIIQSMQEVRSGASVFPRARCGRPLSNMAMLMMMRRMKRAHLTVHGSRSGFRQWAAERTAIPAKVAEMALAHTVVLDQRTDPPAAG